MTDVKLGAALADIATINAFFALTPEPPQTAPRPVSDLWNRPDLLAAEVADVRERLAARAAVRAGDIEERVAASILYQGLATRVLSPVIGALVCHDRSPEPAALCWSPARSGSLALSLGAGAASVEPGTDGRAGAADLVGTHALDGVLAPIGTGLRAQVTVAPRLLWGNAASALAGAANALADARPHHAGEAYAVARLVLTRTPLAGLGQFTHPGAGHCPSFARTTCCLYYRVPGGGTCGDCALVRRSRQSTPNTRE